MGMLGDTATEDEWRLSVRRLVLQREQREYQSFRELVDLNTALSAEVKLLKQQLEDSRAFVHLDDADGDTQDTTGLDEDGSPAGSRNERASSTSSVDSTGSLRRSSSSRNTLGMARMKQRLKAMSAQLQSAQLREVEYNRMRARVLEAEAQTKLMDQRHEQALLAIKNQERFILTQKKELQTKTASLELLQKQIKANNDQILKNETNIRQLVGENEKVVARLIADKAKMQAEMNNMNAVCDALKAQLHSASKPVSGSTARFHSQTPTGGAQHSSPMGKKRWSFSASETLPKGVQRKIKVNCKALAAFSFSGDATRVATADPVRESVNIWAPQQSGWSESPAARLVNMTKLKGARLVELHDNFTIASATADKNVYLLPNTRSRGPPPTLTGHTSDVHCIAGSKDSAKVIGGAQDGSVKFWDASTLKVTASFQYHNGPRVPACTAAVFSGDGNLAAMGYANHDIVLWDCRSNEQITSSRNFHEHAITSLCFAPNAGSQTRLLSAGRDSCLKVIDVRNFEEVHALAAPGFKITSPSANACFSPGGRFAAAGSHNGKVMMWDTISGELKRMIASHTEGVVCCRWSSDKALYVCNEGRREPPSIARIL